MMDYESKQLLHVKTVNSTFIINRVTEKAILIECDDGRWASGGFKPLWIPKSIIYQMSFNDNKQNSQYGIHTVDLPDWFIYQNKNLL